LIQYRIESVDDINWKFFISSGICIMNQGSFQQRSWWHHPFESDGSTIASYIVSQWYICKIFFILYIFIYSFCYLCWKSGIFPGINWLGQYQTAYDIVKTWQICMCFFLQIKTVLYLYMDSLILNQIHLPVTWISQEDVFD